jgi:hypothetical protein
MRSVRFEVLTAVKVKLYLWVVTPYRLVGRYLRFEHTVPIFRADMRSDVH